MYKGIICVPDDFLLSFSKQPPKIYNFDYFEEFLCQSNKSALETKKNCNSLTWDQMGTLQILAGQ